MSDDKKILFSMSGVTKTFQSANTPVLKNIYLSFFYGAKIGILGLNGSGKSTTLYTFLSSLNTSERRIVSIEDPVENKLPGVVQIAVKPEIGLDFAQGYGISRPSPLEKLLGYD